MYTNKTNHRFTLISFMMNSVYFSKIHLAIQWPNQSFWTLEVKGGVKFSINSNTIHDLNVDVKMLGRHILMPLLYLLQKYSFVYVYVAKLFWHIFFRAFLSSCLLFYLWVRVVRIMLNYMYIWRTPNHWFKMEWRGL